MKPAISPELFCLLLFLGMLVMAEVGRAFTLRHAALRAESQKGDFITVETAMFALWGLLIAFTFSGAASRFQEKRLLIAEEANVIETAYMRIDLVTPQAQAALRERFKQYVDSRIEMYHRLPDLKAAGIAMERSHSLQREIWMGAIAATRLSVDDPAGSRLLLPAVNDMIRVTTTRWISLQNHPPGMVYGLLFLLGLLCAVLAGIRMGSRTQRSWFHMLVFPLVTAGIVYITLDVEYPRTGLVRLDQADQILVDVRARMG